LTPFQKRSLKMLTDKTYNHWKLSVDKDHILWLTIDRQGAAVNSLSREIFDELDEIIDGISKDKSLTAVIIKTGKPSGFIAGADIEQFTRIKNREEAFDLIRQAQIILDKLDVLPIPVIAMVEGFCLGGGLELALACDYIVAASDDPKTIFGAPEVKLGIHPGWGGTVRLPERIGVINAMRMNLTGKSFNAKESQRMGLVDAAVPKRQLEHAAHYYALNKPPKHQPVWWQKMLNYPGLRTLVGKKLYQDLEKKVNKAHYPAPYAIVENWIKDGSTNEAMLREAESIATLLLTETSRNLVRVFFLQTRLKSFGKETKFKPLHVHVIGAGVMGGAIAALCAARGIQVTLQDCEPKFIAGAIKHAYKWYSKTMKQPRLVPSMQML
jgi:3-hydroxyacyl-CoA dehydrogenase/enoyl-CoA hydratase/3-hydroxybutyryl-CoA epimerase